jgi:hypothetical protein
MAAEFLSAVSVFYRAATLNLEVAKTGSHIENFRSKQGRGHWKGGDLRLDAVEAHHDAPNSD